MAFVPYFAISPTFIMSIVGLLYGRDPIISNPKDDWRDAIFDLAIPAYNEEKTIVLCLSSIKRQTIQPREIVLYDDLSTDRTVEFAEQFALEYQMNLRIVRRVEQQGKTLALYDISKYSNADVVGVVDADTILKSENYFERLIQELFQGIGRASACGTVRSLTEQDRQIEYQIGNLESYFNRHPQLKLSPDTTKWHLLQRAISNAYRNELYLFLQHIVYHSEMIFLGTLIFPIGCAVVYRRTYLHDILEHYIKLFGFDISDSEDIFIGFAFTRQGYHNVQVSDVSSATMEPRFLKLFNQIFKWSSSYYQCCFYFNSLLNTPFKWPKFILNKWRRRHNNFEEKRQIKESYRQPFGTIYTQKYGRNIGWYIFATAIEKILFPTLLVTLIILKCWFILMLTFVLETSLRACMVLFLHKTHRIRYFLRTYLFSPINYLQVLFDLPVLSRFMSDLWITKNRRWRK